MYYLRCLNAVIVDSYYMPSETREQIDTFESNNVYQNAHSDREKSNEVTYDHYVKPQYKYGYSVFDPETLDMKSQWEHRDGDFVRGAYNVLDADGSMRIVEYISDKDIGFRATVKKIPFYIDELRRQSGQIEDGDKYFKPKHQQYQEPYTHYQSPIHHQPVHQQPILKRPLNEYPAHKRPLSENPIKKKPLNKYRSQSKHNHYTQKYVRKEKEQKNYFNKVENPAPIELYPRLVPEYA